MSGLAKPENLAVILALVCLAGSAPFFIYSLYAAAVTLLVKI